MSPESILFARTVLGTALVSAIGAWRGRLRVLPARDWPQVAGFALTRSPALDAR
jgi:hypothetical protein